MPQIRTLDDLAKLPDAELPGCLKALRSAIQAHRQQEAALAIAQPSRVDRPFPGFEYRPRALKEAQPMTVDRLTPISELPLRYSSKVALRERRVLVLEDLSAISELEVRMCKDIGATSVTLMREMLASVGLTFGPDPDAARDACQRNHALHRLPLDELAIARRDLADSAPVTSLGLSGPALQRARVGGLTTVGHMRDATLGVLHAKFGKSTGREVLQALSHTGAGLRCNPSPLELWKYGLLTTNELTRPTNDATPTQELAPWIGAVARVLAKSGAQTLGELQRLAAQGDIAGIRGVGKNSEQRVLEFLGLVPTGPILAVAKPASSVFSLGET
jgi:hypothetical protein